MPVSKRLAAAVLFAVLFTLIASVKPAFADPQEPPSQPLIDGESDLGTEEGDVEVEDGVVETVISNVSSFFFDTRSLFDLVNSTLAGIVDKSYAQLIPQWEQPLNFALMFTVGYSSQGLESVHSPEGKVDLTEKIYPYWRISLSVAAAFFPLILIANIAQVYTSGSSAPVARAEMLSSVVSALLRFGFVAVSWWAANMAIKISWGLTEQVAAVEIGPSAGEVAALLTRLILKTTLGSLVRPGTALLFFYLLLFIFFLTIMLITALLLSHYAFLALAAVFVVLAPVVIAIGALPFFGWLYGTWLKMVTGILMLPLANVLILKLAFTILPLSGSGSVVRLATALGVIGLLITVNYSIAKTVYSPAMEAAKMAGKSVVGLGKLAGGLLLAGAGGAGLSSAASGMLGGKGGGGSGPDGPNLQTANGVQQTALKQSALSPGQLNALRRKAESGALSAEELAGAKAGWSAAKESARNSLAFRDPLLRGAAGVWMSSKTAPVDKGLAELDGMLRDQGPTGRTTAALNGGAAKAQIPWNQERVKQLVRPTNAHQSEAMYGYARQAFATSQGPFYSDFQAKLGDPDFQDNFEGLLAGAAAAHSDVQPLLGGGSHHAWEVPGIKREQAVAAIQRAGEFFGGEVQTFADAITSQHDSGEEFLGDFQTRSIQTYIQGVIDQFKNRR